MKVFLLDLWLDLKEKRLAPIAVLLVAAVVAVPFVLKKNEKAPPPPPAATTASAAPAGPVVQSASTDLVKNSRLTVFSPRDPFEPTSAPASSTTTSTTTSGTSTGTTTGTSTSTTTTGTTGTGTTGGGTTGSQPTTGTGNTGNTTGTTKTTLFTYTADLKFGQGGAVKTYKNVRRLELVPSEQNPKIVFLGVTATAKTAVFLVDSNLGVDTAEGRCRPSADECTFLYLRPDSDHDEALLTDSDGTVYHLRLLDINRVTVSSSNGTTNTGSGNSNSNSNTNSPAFTGSADGQRNSDETVPGETPPGEPSRPFSYPGFFADSADAPQK